MAKNKKHHKNSPENQVFHWKEKTIFNPRPVQLRLSASSTQDFTLVPDRLSATKAVATLVLTIKQSD